MKQNSSERKIKEALSAAPAAFFPKILDTIVSWVAIGIAIAIGIEPGAKADPDSDTDPDPEKRWVSPFASGQKKSRINE